MNDKKRKFSNKNFQANNIVLYLTLILGMTFVFVAFWGYISPILNTTDMIISQNGNKPQTTANIGTVVNSGGKIVEYPEYGTKYATLMIPSAGISKPVYFGDSKNELSKGIGHYSGSYFPGEGGTIIYSGHNNNVFKDLGKVSVGDKVTIQADYGTFEYKVTDVKIVKTNETQYIEPKHDKETLVMYTCYPFTALGLTTQRFLVIADRV